MEKGLTGGGRADACGHRRGASYGGTVGRLAERIDAEFGERWLSETSGRQERFEGGFWAQWVRKNGLGGPETGFLWGETRDGSEGRVRRMERDGRPERVHPNAAARFVPADVWGFWRRDFRDCDNICFAGRNDRRRARKARVEKIS